MLFVLSSTTKDFSESLSALRDFAQLVGSLLNERQQKFAQQYKRDFLPIMLAVQRIKPELIPPQFKATEVADKLRDSVEIIPGKQNEVHIKLKGEGWHLDEMLKTFNIGNKHQSLLYRSALISLISTAEWFLSQVIRQYFDKYPQASGIDEKTLTFKDLKGMGSISDARRHLLNLRIDEVLWGSFEDWLRFVTGPMKLSASYLNTDREALIEIFQRRNVAVHNNGTVHSSYINKVRPDLRKGVSLGNVLDVSPEYLAQAIDMVEKNFILLAAELWKQLEPENETRAEIITDIVLERLKVEKWPIAEGLSYFLVNDKRLPERSLLVAKLNYWQALKWADRFSEIREEVEAADFTAKDEVFQLARLALLDDDKNFFKLVPRLIKNRKVTREMLIEWPIFRHLRSMSQFQKLTQSRAKKASKPSSAKKSATTTENGSSNKTVVQ
jgi:hypothetical protein